MYITAMAQKQTCLNVDPQEWPVFVRLMKARGVSASKAIQQMVSQVIKESANAQLPR